MHTTAALFLRKANFLALNPNLDLLEDPGDAFLAEMMRHGIDQNKILPGHSEPGLILLEPGSKLPARSRGCCASLEQDG